MTEIRWNVKTERNRFHEFRPKFSNAPNFSQRCVKTMSVIAGIMIILDHKFRHLPVTQISNFFNCLKFEEPVLHNLLCSYETTHGFHRQ